MKALTIQQPRASLIAYGIMETEHRNGEAPELPKRVLIHSGGDKIPDDYLDEVPETVFSTITNAIAFGWLPPFEEMLYSAIIGYADVIAIREAADPAAGQSTHQWVLQNPHLFETPIFNVKGQPGMFDFPLDETDLPRAHVPAREYPRLEGEQLIFPLASHFFDYILDGENEIGLAYDPAIRMLFDQHQIQSGTYPAKTILLNSPGRQACYALKQVEILPVLDEQGVPFTYPDQHGVEQEVLEIYFRLGEQVG